MGIDYARDFVSIPNGKPGPLRPGYMSVTMTGALVSIPNGKPGPLRPQQVIADAEQWYAVSIPNGKPGPLRL